MLVYLYLRFEPLHARNVDWKVELSSKNNFGFSRILMSARVGNLPLEREICAPSTVCRLGVRLSGIFHARAGSFCRQAFRSSSQFHARAYFWCNQYFCRPLGSARAGKSTLERGPCFLKFCSHVLCFVFRSLSLASTLRHVLSIVNEWKRYKWSLKRKMWILNGLNC